jgi:hypothetical protein
MDYRKGERGRSKGAGAWAKGEREETEDGQQKWIWEGGKTFAARGLPPESWVKRHGGSQVDILEFPTGGGQGSATPPGGGSGVGSARKGK